MWSTLAFGSALLAISAGLMISHLIARRALAAADLDDAERAYRRKQFRRRMLASGLIGLVGLAIFGGLRVDGPPGEALYWCGVLLMGVWILILAGADAASTQAYFRKANPPRGAEHAALRKEINRYHHHGNAQRRNEESDSA